MSRQTLDVIQSTLQSSEVLSAVKPTSPNILKSWKVAATRSPLLGALLRQWQGFLGTRRKVHASLDADLWLRVPG